MAYNMTTTETCRKVKALFFIALLAGAEAKGAQQASANSKFQEETKALAEQMEALQANRNFQEETQPFAKDVDTLMANPSFETHTKAIAEEMATMMAKPGFQQQTQEFADEMQVDQFEAMMASPEFREQATSIMAHMQALQGDPQFQWQTKHVAEHVETLKNFPEQAQRIAEEAEAMNAEPGSQEKAQRVADEVKRISKQMEELKAYPHLQQMANGAAEQVQKLLADPAFNGEAKRLNDQVVAMKADPQSKEHEKLVATKMEEFKVNQKFVQHARLFAEQVEKIKADPTLQELAMRAAERVQEALGANSGRRLQATEDEASVDNTIDDVISRLADQFTSRAFAAAPIEQPADLESSTLGKAAQLAQSAPAARAGVKVQAAPRAGALRLPWHPAAQQRVMPLATGGDDVEEPAEIILPSGVSASAPSKAGSIVVRGAAAAPTGLQAIADMFCNLFAVWLTIAAIAAVQVPATFMWIPDKAFTGLLGLLMFSVGVTTTLDDFRQCLKKPLAVGINFFACYGIMPAVAYATAIAMKADAAIMAGLVLVGSINGGQASNLCTLIAGGDVALSVLMTTSTTLGCIVMTPLICQTILGAVVPVNAIGIVYSTFQVVLAPIFLGVGVNTLAPKFAKAVEPYTPVAGVVATVLLVGAAVAKVAPTIIAAGWPLQVACLNLHLVGGILGYFATKAAGFDEKTCRTVAIETAMKSSAFGFLLASQHFGVFNVRVPSAVSVVWMAITGSIMAIYWKFQPVEDKGRRLLAMDSEEEEED